MDQSETLTGGEVPPIIEFTAGESALAESSSTGKLYVGTFSGINNVGEYSVLVQGPSHVAVKSYAKEDIMRLNSPVRTATEWSVFAQKMGVNFEVTSFKGLGDNAVLDAKAALTYIRRSGVPENSRDLVTDAFNVLIRRGNQARG